VPPLAAVPDLERELDALYALPLNEFTKARNDLAARLKRAHQSDASAAVKSLKKPTNVAWTANHLARVVPDQVASLLEAGRRLRETQQQALSGEADPDEVAAATSAQRTAVRLLVGSAKRELADRATPALLDRLDRTLQASAVDETARDLLGRGRLTDEVTAVGFGPLEVVERRGPSPDDIARAARERLTALRSEARRLSAEARTAEASARDAERAAEVLRTEAAQLRSEADRAARDLAEAEAAFRTRRG
jgi:hypothetical protein